MKTALYWLRQNDPTDPEWIQQYVLYIGMMGTTGQAEIDLDEKRMIEAGLMDAKCEQMMIYVPLDEFHSSEHDAARDAERYCMMCISVGRCQVFRQATRVSINQRMNAILSRGLVTLAAHLLRPSARPHERRSIECPID